MSNIEADVSVGIMTGPDFDIETSNSSSSMDNRKSIEANYASRWFEISRFTGAPAQAAFYYEDLPTASTNEEVTADAQIGNVIGNGAGFLFGLLMHFLIKPYYRTGEHDLLWASTKPDRSNISSLPMQCLTAYVRYGDELFYVNKITNEVSSALKISAGCSVDKLFTDIGVSLNGSKTLDSKELSRVTTSITDHSPYNGKPSSNPLYRNFKTLANLGWQIGATISNFLGIEDPIKKKMMSCIMSDVICIVVGLFAFPYWLIREKVFKIPPNSKHKYAITGQEGWSKYLRTALAFGISVGQAIGGILAAAVLNASAAVASFSIAFWGGVVGVGSFILGLVVVPLINWVTGSGYSVYLLSDDAKTIPPERASEKAIFLKKYRGGHFKAFIMRGDREESTDIHLTPGQLVAMPHAPLSGETQLDAALSEAICDQCTLGALASDAKNDYKNNYTRTGMTLFAGIFAAIGIFVGQWIFGMILSGIIFSAIGSVFGGVLFSFISRQLHRWMHPYPEGDWRDHEAKVKALKEEGAKTREFQVCLLDSAVDFDVRKDFDKLPNGRRTIILKKEGQKIKAYWVNRDKLLPRGNLRLSIKDYEFLSERFAKHDQLPHTLKRTDSQEMKDLVDLVYDQSEDIDNTWDYAARSSAGVFGFIGAAVVCLLNPAAALLLVPIGSAIAGTIGWVVGILVVRAARGQEELEPKADTLPWTMRIMTGANVGSIVGGILGIVVGLAGFIFAGPASIIIAVSFFGAVGAVVGGIVGALWEAKAREMIYKGIVSLFWDQPASDDGDSPDNSNNKDLRNSSRHAAVGSTAQALSSLPSTPSNRAATVTANDAVAANANPGSGSVTVDIAERKSAQVNQSTLFQPLVSSPLDSTEKLEPSRIASPGLSLAIEAY